MIISSARFRVALGKNMPAMEYFGQLTKHLHKVTGAEYSVYTQLGGPAGHVLISARFESLQAWDIARKKITGDAEWQKMAAKAAEAGLFIQGSVETSIWEQV
jgi:hypothetical protein